MRRRRQDGDRPAEAQREQLLRAARQLHGQLVAADTRDLWPHSGLRDATDECGRLLVALLHSGERADFACYERIHSLLETLAGLLGFQLRPNPDPEALNPFTELFRDELDHQQAPTPWRWRSDGPDRGSELW